MGRPPIQHHRVHLQLPDDWEDVADRIREIVTIQALGRASAGFLGNPGLSVLFFGSVLGGLGAIVGIDGAAIISNFFGALENLHNAPPHTQEQRDAVNDFTSAQRALIEFFAPFLKGFLPGVGEGRDPFIVEPATPEEQAVQEEKIRREGEIGL